MQTKYSRFLSLGVLALGMLAWPLLIERVDAPQPEPARSRRGRASVPFQYAGKARPPAGAVSPGWEPERRWREQVDWGPVVAADLFDVATCRQRANDAVRIHAANGSDLGTRDRPLVRNECECLQGCAREAGALSVGPEGPDVPRQGCPLSTSEAAHEPT